MRKKKFEVIFTWLGEILTGICIAWVILFCIGNIWSIIDKDMCDRSNNFRDYTFLVFKCINQKFNPETDVCESWNDQYIGLRKCEKVDLPLKQTKGYCCYNYEEGGIGCMPVKYCLKWRPKNPCELNPNNEDCVCDEYEREELYKINGWYCNQCEDKRDDCSGFDFKGNYTYVNQKYEEYSGKGNCGGISGITLVQDKGNCIKAHESDECEKGNPNWINDCDKWELTAKDNTSFNGFSSYIYTDEAYKLVVGKDFYTEAKCVEGYNCRKKTIKDLTCEELKGEYIKKENTYCPKYQIGFLCFGKWRESEYGTEKEILFEYLEGCKS